MVAQYGRRFDRARVCCAARCTAVRGKGRRVGLRRRRDDYDIVVIGGGSAGLTIGRLGPQLGARVAIVEAERLGGDCTWHGCVPSKALLAAGRAAVAGRDRAALGLPAGLPTGAVEIGPVLARIRALQEQIYAESDRPETLPDVDVIEGRGRFVSPREVEVGGRRLGARTFVSATGSSPIVPPIPGLAASGYLTNHTVFDIERLPARLVVIGGGPTGLELGQAFQRLGSAVTVVEAEPRILPRAEAPVSAALWEALAGEGMSILTDTSVVEVVSEGRGDGEERVVRVRGPDGSGEVRADAILVAAGQRPNVEGLGLDAAGVALADDGAVRVDARLRTSNRRVYACGDVTGGHQFTHAASYEAGVVLRNALFPIGRQRVGYRSMPWVVFTDPEVAGVGLSEAAARARHGDAVHVYEQSFREVDRALIDGRTAGFLRMVTVGRRRRVVGAQIVGPAAGEMIQEHVLAIARRMTALDLAMTHHAYPTLNEVSRWAALSAVEEVLASGWGRRLVGLGRRVRRWSG